MEGFKEDEVLLLREFCDLARLVGVCSERLLEQDMLSRIQSLLRPFYGVMR